jgi:hypothetical protein
MSCQRLPKLWLPSGPPELLGPCLLCGETFEGPGAIRLKHGCVKQRKWGVEFLDLPFDDHSKIKWVCKTCSWESGLVSDDTSVFSDKLYGLSSDGQCCLCNQVIEPYPLEDWSSAVLIELGSMTPSSKGDFSIFHVSDSGHVHYMCMDEFNIELWRMIERVDEPDYLSVLRS